MNSIDEFRIEATFCMRCDEADAARMEWDSQTFHPDCLCEPVMQASFSRVDSWLHASILIQHPLSDAIRVALRFNPISLLSQRNPQLRDLLEPFALVTPVKFTTHILR